MEEVERKQKSCDKKLVVGYEEQAAADKVRYEKEKEEYNANLDSNDCDRLDVVEKKVLELDLNVPSRLTCFSAMSLQISSKRKSSKLQSISDHN